MKQFFIKLINLFLSIFMRRRMLLSAGGGVEIPSVDPSLAPPLSVVFANKEDNSLIIVEPDKWDTDLLPPSKFEPIGIVVIPGEHGVLKDGTGTKNQCGVMSIVSMSSETPETGVIEYDTMMYWGYESLDISGKSDGLDRYDSRKNDGLINYQHIAITSDNTSNVASDYSSSNYANIPAQNQVSGTPTRYTPPYAPSPYIGSDYKSGGYNETYGLKNGVVGAEANNVLSDFSGIVNTKIITDLAIAQSDWKTSSDITNIYNVDGCYPAACCCARFHTTGTKAFVDCTIEELRNGSGFWYLPAAGELGYINPRLYDINDTINKLKTAYNVGNPLTMWNYFWTSSEYSSNGVYSVSTNYGMVYIRNKDWPSYVRAFMRL